MNEPSLIIFIKTQKKLLLFRPDPAEYVTTLLLKVNNQTLPTKRIAILCNYSRIDPKLTFLQLINLTIITAKQMLNIFKHSLPPNGVNKKLIVSLFKAISPHIGICKHRMEPYHVKHQHQETAKHSEHSFAYSYWLHKRQKQSTATM